jgi:hypothetical protein
VFLEAVRSYKLCELLLGHYTIYLWAKAIIPGQGPHHADGESSLEEVHLRYHTRFDGQCSAWKQLVRAMKMRGTYELDGGP